MNIGVALSQGDTGTAPNVVDEFLAQAGQAASAGLASVWFSQVLEHDAIVLAALAGRATPGIRVGTAVVPMYPRHPLLLASAAQTVQAATGGRFTLGLGLGAKGFLEPIYGNAYPPPIRHLREYLTVLRQAIAGEPFDFDGETVSAHPPAPTAVGGGEDVPLIVAAMGPQALRVTGELADGTFPYLATPRALGEHIVPLLTKAAEEAGRPAPRVVVGLNAVVTDDADEVREVLTSRVEFYGSIPSYQRVMALGGVSHPIETTLIGDEQAVEAGLRSYFDAGATEIILIGAGVRSAEDRLRTWRLGGALSSSGR